MRITESKLRSIIRGILLEKGPADHKSGFNSKREMNAHLLIMPMLDYKGLKEKRGIYKFHHDVVKETGLSTKHDQRYFSFVIKKNKDNIEALIKHIGKADKDPERASIDEINAEYLRSTLKDNLPVLIRSSVGDGIATRVEPKQTNIGSIGMNDVIQWAIHDLYHTYEAPIRKRYPSDTRYRKGFVALPALDGSYGPDAREKQNIFASKGIKSKEELEEAEENIRRFFYDEGFTKLVGRGDIYPSIFAYIIMNIENKADIDGMMISKYIRDNEIIIFEHMFSIVDKYDDWLKKKDNRNKIYIETADFNVAHDDERQEFR